MTEPQDVTELAERHLDRRNPPPGHAGWREPELPASEWRAAYFVLARIALEQLDECRAALAASPAPDPGAADAVARAYAAGHRDGLGCGVQSAGFGFVECEHVGRFAALAPSAEPPETDRQLRKWQQQAAPGCMRYGSEEDCDPACAEWCALMPPAEPPETET